MAVKVSETVRAKLRNMAETGMGYHTVDALINGQWHRVVIIECSYVDPLSLPGVDGVIVDVKQLESVSISEIKTKGKRGEIAPEAGEF